MNIYYLVRHAHAEWTADENRPLSNHGQEDALRVADLLQDFPISRIYTSPYRRAVQTISPLAELLKVEIETALELRERQLGSFAAGDFISAVEITWNDPLFAYPGGESNAAAQLRARSFLDPLQQHHGEHIVLSTHGNLMALLLRSFDDSINFAFWRALTMPDIFTLTIEKNGRCDINRMWSEID